MSDTWTTLTAIRADSSSKGQSVERDEGKRKPRVQANLRRR
jgi:hypothetical protein